MQAAAYPVAAPQCQLLASLQGILSLTPAVFHCISQKLRASACAADTNHGHSHHNRWSPDACAQQCSEPALTSPLPPLSPQPHLSCPAPFISPGSVLYHSLSPPPPTLLPPPSAVSTSTSCSRFVFLLPWELQLVFSRRCKFSCDSLPGVLFAPTLWW